MDSQRLAINSIYRATEGEGLFVGTPQVFVRFQGCAIGCVNCDSKDTWGFPLEGTLSFSELMDSIHKEGREGKIKRVSITGGDPLHPKNVPDVLKLAGALREKGYWINIEAAGTRIVPEVFDLVNYISFDLKTPSTHVRVRESLFEKLIEQYPGKFQIKAVVESLEDFAFAHQMKRSIDPEGVHPWILTPCYNNGEEFPMKRFQEVVSLNEREGGPFRVIGQQHKWMFGPDKQQV